MTIANLHILKIGIVFLFIVLFTSCQDDSPYSLRSNDNEFYYTINNKQAAGRLASIMYNRKDTSNPVERFKLVHISDAHLSDWSSDNNYKYPNNLIEAVTFANQGELRINAMAATGDHISFGKKKDALAFMESFFTHLYAENRIPTFPSYGNHDANMNEKTKREYITLSELSGIFNNRGNYTLQRESGKSYYYADVSNPMGGMIRFITLNPLDQPGTTYNTMNDAVFSQEQIDWLGTVALRQGMTENHHVIILTHYPFQPSYSGYLSSGSFVHSSMMVPEIIEAFRSKQSLRKSYSGLTKPAPITVDFDFSAAPGNFICHLGGHAHVTARFTIEELSNRSTALPPQHMLLCTNMSPSDNNIYLNKVKRSSGSLVNNSFCIYAIDTQERKIYITFFGAYLPSNLSQDEYPEVQEISY